MKGRCVLNPLKAILAVAPGINPVRAARQMWDTTKEMGKHGAHEIAAALFHGNSAFVMYPRAGRENEAARQQERGHER
jgi:hypothetical protein